MPQILEIAFWNVARTSPTLPPSAISTSAMRGLPRAHQDHADIVKDRGDRRVRLVDGDLDRVDTREGRQNGIRDGAGRALEQLVIGILERRAPAPPHLAI